MPRRKRRLREAYSSRNKTRLIRGGKPYFDCLLDMIATAKESFHLQTYIYDDDNTGQTVANALKEAVRRGVQVYLLADGYASKVMSRNFVNELKAAGIHFRFFNPLFKGKQFYFGRRLHHKLAVSDARYALVGGVNISDRYNDLPDKPAWLDFAVYIEGEAATELCILCWKSWNNYPPHMPLTPCEQQEIKFEFDQVETSLVGIRRNDWVRRKNEISATYSHMLRSANSHVTILCSYFLPGLFIRRQLEYAVKKGIRVRVITAGLSDVLLAKYAERYMYNWLLRNKIELYEYQPSVLHGKIAVCDSEWMTIGSYNINNISAYASIELNVNVRDERLAGQAEEQMQHIIQNDCIQVTPDDYHRAKTIFNQFARWLSYEFIRVVFYLFTFYFKHTR